MLIKDSIILFYIMEQSKIVQVTDINRKRSSLKNPEDMRKILDFKSKNLQFELDVIQEIKEVSQVKTLMHSS